MNPSVTCYPIPGKPKARLLCDAFAAGVRAAGGSADVCLEPPAQLKPGVAVFYGVRPAVAHLWEQARAQGRPWAYIDNSYFDATRERHFRITMNAIQHTGQGSSDGQRFAALGLKVQPMRAEGAGDYALVCAQSDEFMRVVAADPGWLDRVSRNLDATGHRTVIRFKHTMRSLQQDLTRARVLVTWSSAAAVTALLGGVRVLCAPQCCATYAGEDRRRWASVLADNQWTVDEIAGGVTWKALNA